MTETTKDKVLRELTLNRPYAISGQDLARKCGVSRAAIWKAVNNLRNSGITVSGTPNGGYVLSEDCDPINAQLITESLKTLYPSLDVSHVECFETIDSTNIYAKKLLLANEPAKFNRAVIVSQSQTLGRGRLGRTFVSPSGTGIYISLIWAPKGGIKETSRLTAACAVGVCRALYKICGVKPSVKWINDIYMNGKKVCGILAEGVSSFETGLVEAAVIGIGINIKTSKAFEEAGIESTAGGVADCSNGRQIRRTDVVSAVAGEVFGLLDQNNPLIMDEYKSLLFMLGKEVRVYSVSESFPPYTATAVDVDENAALVVRLQDGTTKHLVSAEVSAKPSTSA